MEFCVISKMKAEQLCESGFGLFFMKPAVISFYDPGEEDNKVDFFFADRPCVLRGCARYRVR